jgi:hypothetical protein
MSKTAEPVITLDQLIEQLRRHEGEQIINGLGLALTIFEAVHP